MPVLFVTRMIVEGVSKSSFGSGAISFPFANIHTTYGVPDWQGALGDSPALTRFEYIPYATISMEASAEVITVEGQYKWEDEELNKGKKPTQDRGVVTPVAIHTISLNRVEAHKIDTGIDQIQLTAGRVNDARYNGVPAGHLKFMGLTLGRALGPSFQPYEVVLKFHERYTAPWNYALNPNHVQTTGPYTDTNWWPLSPAPWKTAAFGTVIGALA